LKEHQYYIFPCHVVKGALYAMMMNRHDLAPNLKFQASLNDCRMMCLKWWMPRWESFLG